jgi:hypothetical protein
MVDSNPSDIFLFQVRLMMYILVCYEIQRPESDPKLLRVPIRDEVPL